MPENLLRSALLVVFLTATALAAEPWPQWRGPRGDGHVTSDIPPLRFSAADVAWKTPLPGRGQSSPIIWDDRVFLTAALDDGAARVVLAVDRSSGRILWQKTAWTGTPEPTHQMNGWASASCATDGERVYAFFGKGGGLFCYSKDGEQLWSKNLGEFVGPWGTAACPILFEDLVIQNCDAEADASLIAFHKLTGAVAWKSARENYRGWSTPFLFQGTGEPQLVLNGHTGVRSYDPLTGKEMWFCSSAKGRGEPTVTPDEDGRLFVVSGLAGPTYAVDATGRGDVSNSKRIWQTPRKTGRDLPSPAVVGRHLLVMAMKGILTCYDTTNGQPLWEERIGGNFSASPVVADGKALFVAEEGEIVVIDPTAASPVVSRNLVGSAEEEIFRSSLAAHDGQWLLRSDRMLYCIGRK